MSLYESNREYTFESIRDLRMYPSSGSAEDIPGIGTHHGRLDSGKKLQLASNYRYGI
jgi:hypothetical protein